MADGEGDYGNGGGLGGGGRRGKKWDNCNSIKNKIYFFNLKNHSSKIF